VEIDLENLRRHYARPSDEALAGIDPDDSVEAAQPIYDLEVARRPGLAPSLGVVVTAPILRFPQTVPPVPRRNTEANPTA
jgi:hypothetical protein